MSITGALRWKITALALWAVLVTSAAAAAAAAGARPAPVDKSEYATRHSTATRRVHREVYHGRSLPLQDQGGDGFGEETGDQNLAEVLLLELREARNGEEFAATLAEAFQGAGQRGGEGELATKLLVALEKDGGEQGQLAEKLLAELDASQQEELADALLSGMRPDSQDLEVNVPPEYVAGAAQPEGNGEYEEQEPASALATALGVGGRDGSAIELLISKLLNIDVVEDSATAAHSTTNSGEVVVAGNPPGASSSTQGREDESAGASAQGGNDVPVHMSTAEKFTKVSNGVRDSFIPLSAGVATGGDIRGTVEGDRSHAGAILPDRMPGVAESNPEGERGGGSVISANNPAGEGGPGVTPSWPLVEGLLTDLLHPGDPPSDLLQQHSSEEGGFGSGSAPGDTYTHSRLSSSPSQQSKASSGNEVVDKDEEEEEGEEGEVASISWFFTSEEDVQDLGNVQSSVAAEARRHRRLGTSDEEEEDGDIEIDIVATTGATSTDWNGAKFTLEVGTLVPGQTLSSGTVLARGEIEEGDDSMETTPVELERGCYVLFTSAGTRPYDVVWEVQIDGEVYQDIQGGGQDRHTFGVGGALCDMSDCYRQCYEDQNDLSSDECASLGDLLAPPDEPAGANCTCTQEEELDLRLTCLSRECDSRSQCYLLDEAAEEITMAQTMRITMYVTVVTSLVEQAGMESTLGQWLDFDASYVELERVNGLEVAGSTLVTRRNLEGEPDGEEGDRFPEMDGEARDWQTPTRSRGLQTGTFKRLEFRIVGSSSEDFDDAQVTIAEGVREFNAILAAQDEESGVQEVEAYTVEYTVNSENVAVADVPDVSIAGTGGGDGTGVDDDGDAAVQGTEEPAEFGDFTRSTQFLIGAGLVVVVSFFLSILACIVCHMKRKERKEFVRKNASPDGVPKPVAYVDPWGSVARTFQNDPKGSANGSDSTKSGSRTGSGSTTQGSGGRNTANSSASS